MFESRVTDIHSHERILLVFLMMENLSDSPTIDETLVQLGVENETSIATLISALKGILSKAKKHSRR